MSYVHDIIIIIIIIVVVVVVVVVVGNGSGVSYRPLAAETLVRSQTGLRGICGGQTGPEKVPHPKYFKCFVSIIPPMTQTQVSFINYRHYITLANNTVHK